MKKKKKTMLKSQFHKTEALNYGLVYAFTWFHRIIALTTQFKCLNYLTAPGEPALIHLY